MGIHLLSVSISWKWVPNYWKFLMLAKLWHGNGSNSPCHKILLQPRCNQSATNLPTDRCWGADTWPNKRRALVNADMNKHDQTNISGIGTTPDYTTNMDFFVQMDIIFIEVKDRSRQLPLTTNESELTKDIEYEDLSGIDLFVKFCEDQESLI